MLTRIQRYLPASAYYPLQLMPILFAVEWRFRLSEVSFTLAELALPIVLAVAAAASLYSAKVRASRSCVLLAIATAATAFLSVLLQNDTRHTVSVYRDLMAPVLFYIAFTTIRLRPLHAFRLAKAFIVWASLGSLLAIAQFVTNDYLWFQSDETAVWQEYKSKLAADSSLGQLLGVSQTLSVGLQSHPNNFASYLVIPTLLAYVLARRGRILPRLFWASCVLAQVAGMVCTFSRSSVLTFVVAVVGYELLVERKRQIRVSTILLAAAVTAGVTLFAINTELFAFDELGTFDARLDMFRSGLTLVADHPLALFTGGLTEMYMNAFYWFNQLVHNCFLYLVLQFGLFATISWTWLLVREMRTIGRDLSSAGADERRLGGAALLGVFVSVFFYGQTYSLLDSVQIGMWLFFWLGISRHMVRLRRGEDGDGVETTAVSPVPDSHTERPGLGVAARPPRLLTEFPQ